MSKKVVIILISITLGIILAINLLLFLQYSDKLKNTNELNVIEYLEYGDSFNKIYLYDLNNNLYSSNPNTPYKVVIYLLASCQSCIEELGSFKNLINIFSNEQLEFQLVWEGDIPLERIKKINIPLDINYSLKSERALSNTTPTAYIVNKEGEIIFSCRARMESLVSKLIEINEDKINDTKDKALTNLKNELQIDNKRPYLFLFATSDCEGCKLAEEFLQVDKLVESKYNLITIVNESQNHEKIYMDNFLIYSKLFNINKYPSFILVNDNKNEIFFNTTDINELQEFLYNN